MKIHIDIDCFFVSAARTLDSSLHNRPVAIGGRSDQYIFSKKGAKQELNLLNSGSFVPAFFQEYQGKQGSDIAKFTDDKGKIRGILTTASYEAREYGIKTAMNISEALRLCPSLIIKAPNMTLYQKLSHDLADFLHKKIPLLEQASIDEFYGDLDGWIEDKDVPYFIDILRHEIQQELNLPVSIGAAHTKSIAKLATSSAKPFGCRTILKKDFRKFVENIATKDFPGIGKSMQNRLNSAQIFTLGELIDSRSHVESMSPYAKELYKKVSGLDREKVKLNRVRKSIGISRTFDPIIDRDELIRRVTVLSRHLSYAIMRLDVLPTTYHLGISYVYNQNSSSNITENRLFSESFFKSLCLKLFLEADSQSSLKILRLSISCSHFTCNSRRELSLLTFEQDQKMRKLTLKTKILRDKYGLDIIRFANEL